MSRTTKKIKKKLPVAVLTGAHCDFCGRRLQVDNHLRYDPQCAPDNPTLADQMLRLTRFSIHFGYPSRFDGGLWEADVCDPCFEHILKPVMKKNKERSSW